MCVFHCVVTFYIYIKVPLQATLESFDPFNSLELRY